MTDFKPLDIKKLYSKITDTDRMQSRIRVSNLVVSECDICQRELIQMPGIKISIPNTPWTEANSYALCIECIKYSNALWEKYSGKI